MVGKGKTSFLRRINKEVERYARSLDFESPARDKTFRIGVLTSLSGRWKKGGFSTKRGYDIWAEKVNKSGGIEIAGEKYRVQLIYYDIESDQRVAKRAARELITYEDVDFIFGPYSSELTLAVAPIIEKNNIPHITGSAESQEILKKGFRWTFGVLLGNPAGMKAPLKALKERINSRLMTTAIICANDVFSQSMAEAFLVTSEELGFKLTHYQTFPLDQGNLTYVISKVDKSSPDVCIVCGHVDDLINTVKAAKAVGFNPGAFVMHYGVASQDFVDALGDDAAKVLGVSQWSPRSNSCGPVFGTSKNFYDLFVKRYGRDPDHIEAGSAASGVVFQQAIQLAGIIPPMGQDEKREIRDILAQNEFATFFGPIDFSSSE